MARETSTSPQRTGARWSSSDRFVGALHVTADLRRVLRVGGPALLAAAVAAGVARPASPLVWFLLGAGIVVLVAAAVARTSDRGCVFCGAQRADVTFLVAGPCLSICPDCTAAASASIAEELERRGKAIEWAPLFLGRLPERSPLELTRPYVELVASRDRSPAGIRGAAGACFRFGHHGLARELLDRIPEVERTDSDWINLGVALGDECRWAEALAATLRAAPADGGPRNPWVLANGAWFEARVHPDAPREDLERWLRQAVDARELLAASPPPGTEGTVELRRASAAFLGTEADLRRRMGDASAALRALAEAEALAPGDGTRLLLRARALADLGRIDEAREDALKASALLRPGSPDAEDARRILETLL